jgi:hypothetical protein
VTARQKYINVNVSHKKITWVARKAIKLHPDMKSHYLEMRTFMSNVKRGVNHTGCRWGTKTNIPAFSIAKVHALSSVVQIRLRKLWRTSPSPLKPALGPACCSQHVSRKPWTQNGHSGPRMDRQRPTVLKNIVAWSLS